MFLGDTRGTCHPIISEERKRSGERFKIPPLTAMQSPNIAAFCPVAEGGLKCLQCLSLRLLEAHNRKISKQVVGKGQTPMDAVSKIDRDI